MRDHGVFAAYREAMQYRDLLKNLTQRELRGRYRRTFLGWGWSLLQPVMMTAVYAIMLGWYFKVKPLPGDPSGIDTFAFFLLAGVLPWNFFSSSLVQSMGTVVGAGGLMTRVWFPRLLLPLSTILALAVSLCIELAILTMAISLLTQTMMLQLVPVTILLIAMQVLFTSGIAFWLTACNVRFRDVEYLTTVFLLAYFYLTPIIYPVTYIPDEPVLGTSVTWRELALANPMARFTMAYRNVLYDVRMPGLPTILFIIGWSLFSAYFGTRFFIRRADRFAELM